MLYLQVFLGSGGAHAPSENGGQRSCCTKVPCNDFHCLSVSYRKRWLCAKHPRVCLCAAALTAAARSGLSRPARSPAERDAPPRSSVSPMTVLSATAGPPAPSDPCSTARRLSINHLPLQKRVSNKKNAFVQGVKAQMILPCTESPTIQSNI